MLEGVSTKDWSRSEIDDGAALFVPTTQQTIKHDYKIYRIENRQDMDMLAKQIREEE